MSDVSNHHGNDDCTRLRVFLNGGSRLIPDTRLVHLRSDDFHQINRIVNARGSKALNLFWLSVVLAAGGGLCGHGGSNGRTPSGDGTWASGLRGCFLLWSGFLYVACRLFFCEQSRVLGLAGELRLSLLFLILLCFGGLRAIFPLGCFRPFLEKCAYAYASIERDRGGWVVEDCAHLCYSFCSSLVCLVLCLLCAAALFLCISALGSHDWML